MNSYKQSDGTRISQATLERKIKAAKEQKLNDFFDEHGYWVCEDCWRNDCLPIDCSHNVSIDEAKKTGRAELCYSVANIKLRGRECHRHHDKNKIKWTFTKL
jgi:hypothetical protein